MFFRILLAGVRFGDILLDRGLITAEDLRKVLQKNLAKKLLDGFSWFNGNDCADFPEKVDSTLKVNVSQLIILGVTRFATQAQVDASIGPLIGQPLALHPDPFFKLEEIRMAPRQRSIIETLENGPTADRRTRPSTGIDDEDLTRILFALTLIGIVISNAPPKAGTTDPAGPAVPSGDHPIGKPSVVKTNRKRRTALMEMVLNFRRKDAFDLLGVDPDGLAGGSGKVPRLRRRVCSLDLSERPYGGRSSGLHRRVQAFGELSDPDRRQALANRRKGLEARRAVSTPFESRPISSIPTSSSARAAP